MNLSVLPGRKNEQFQFLAVERVLVGEVMFDKLDYAASPVSSSSAEAVRRVMSLLVSMKPLSSMSIWS